MVHHGQMFGKLLRIVVCGGATLLFVGYMVWRLSVPATPRPVTQPTEVDVYLHNITECSHAPVQGDALRACKEPMRIPSPARQNGLPEARGGDR
jgi:hypothetical protein